MWGVVLQLTVYLSRTLTVLLHRRGISRIFDNREFFHGLNLFPRQPFKEPQRSGAIISLIFGRFTLTAYIFLSRDVLLIEEHHGIVFKVMQDRGI